MAERYDYIRDPEEIYRRSFALLREEADLTRLPKDLGRVAERVIHACGMPEIIENLRYSSDLVEAGCGALRSGATVLADCHMVKEGIIAKLLPGANEVLCTLRNPETATLATRYGTTRSAAAVELWRPRLAGSVVVIGNAPTTLFHLMERMHIGWPSPAAILAFPVGFVGAAESKAALHRDFPDVPHITLLGRSGGSAMASAALNALSVLAR
ncbi:MAG: precorrin-8X methylmutase [Kiloniellales bacterium]|nr:precorrin-8X methylmutase [Kiloniellales bacterium]